MHVNKSRQKAMKERIFDIKLENLPSFDNYFCEGKSNTSRFDNKREGFWEIYAVNLMKPLGN